MLPNIPQLKLGDILRYHPSDILLLSNHTSTTTSLYSKFNSRWENVLWLLQKNRNICLFIKLYQKTLKRKHPNQQRVSYLLTLQNTWRIINTIATIFFKNMLVYLSLDIICSWKLTVSTSLALTKLFALWNRQYLQ